MSKNIVMSVLFSTAISIGGFFVSCGDKSSQAGTPTVIQMPAGCTLVSPKDELGELAGGAPIARLKPGKNHFEINCGERTVTVDRTVTDGQRTVAFTEDDLR